VVPNNPVKEDIMKEQRSEVYCTLCGGTNVQIAGWIDPNCPTTYFGDFGTFNEEDSAYCMDCDKHGCLAQRTVEVEVDPLKHFGTEGDVLSYVLDEIVASLEEDLENMRVTEGDDADIVIDLGNKIHDIKAIEDLVMLKQDWTPGRGVASPKAPSSEQDPEAYVICTNINICRRIGVFDDDGNLQNCDHTGDETPDIDPGSVEGSTVEEILADVERRIVDWCEESLHNPEGTTRDRWACMSPEDGIWSAFLATGEDVLEVTILKSTQVPACDW
jgi:hypothetical protein